MIANKDWLDVVLTESLRQWNDFKNDRKNYTIEDFVKFTKDIADGITDGFPTLEEIKEDYYKLMEIIKYVRTIEQAQEIQGKYVYEVEINGYSIDEYLNGLKLIDGTRSNYRGTNEEIEWIRYSNFGCLSYIYDRFDGKPMFDVWSDYFNDEFIRDITIDDLTEELYKNAKLKTIK